MTRLPGLSAISLNAPLTVLRPLDFYLHGSRDSAISPCMFITLCIWSLERSLQPDMHLCQFSCSEAAITESLWTKEDAPVQ